VVLPDYFTNSIVSDPLVKLKVDITYCKVLLKMLFYTHLWLISEVPLSTISYGLNVMEYEKEL
jgi:hypothetical protein